MSSELYTVNKGKSCIVEANGTKFLCYVIKTHVVTKNDNLHELVKKFTYSVMQKNDVLFISEKMVSCTQNRAIPIENINSCFWACLLSKFVTKSKHGIGLSIPETMQCAINECGIFRILAASFIGMIGKMFGRKGWFYKIAGYKALSIDGPCEYAIPPYNNCVVLGPEDPNKIAYELSKMFDGVTVLIVDLNDLGGNILGTSDKNCDKQLYLKLLKQNPLGQSCESTPIGFLRPFN